MRAVPCVVGAILLVVAGVQAQTWSREFGLPAGCSATAAELSPVADGGFVVGMSLGSCGVAISRHDSTGARTWLVSLEEPGISRKLTGVGVLSSGRTIAVGTDGRGQDAWAAAFDDDGSLAWQESFGATAEIAHAAALGDEVACIGWADGGWSFRLDASGAITSQVRAPTGERMALLPDGGLLIAGTVALPGAPELPSVTGGYLARLDPAGQPLWCRRQQALDGGVECEGWGRWPPNDHVVTDLDVFGSDVLVTHEKIDDCGSVLERVIMTTTLGELDACSRCWPRIVPLLGGGSSPGSAAAADAHGRIILADGRVDVGSAWSVQWPEAGAAAATLALRRIAGAPVVVVAPPGRIIVARLGSAPGFDAISGLPPEPIPPNVLVSSSGNFSYESVDCGPVGLASVVPTPSTAPWQRPCPGLDCWPDAAVEDCGNGADDDADGDVDCLDASCALAPACDLSDADGDGIPDVTDCAPGIPGAVLPDPGDLDLRVGRRGGSLEITASSISNPGSCPAAEVVQALLADLGTIPAPLPALFLGWSDCVPLTVRRGAGNLCFLAREVGPCGTTPWSPELTVVGPVP